MVCTDQLSYEQRGAIEYAVKVGTEDSFRLLWVEYNYKVDALTRNISMLNNTIKDLGVGASKKSEVDALKVKVEVLQDLVRDAQAEMQVVREVRGEMIRSKVRKRYYASLNDWSPAWISREQDRVKEVLAQFQAEVVRLNKYSDSLVVVSDHMTNLLNDKTRCDYRGQINRINTKIQDLELSLDELQGYTVKRRLFFSGV